VLPPGKGESSSLADIGRFTALIDVYTTLATGDAVVDKLKRRGLLTEDDLEDDSLPISAEAVPSTVNAATPMMTITGNSISGPKATKLTLATTQAFLEVVRARQDAADIPLDDRVQLRVVRGSEAPELVDPRSKALPILVLLGGLIATLAVAFTRHNLGAKGELAIPTSHEMPMKPDVSVDAGDSRHVPRAVPNSQASNGQEETGRAAGAGRALSTLGSLSRAGSGTAREEASAPEKVSRQARRR
jgi:hypothetical protein